MSLLQRLCVTFSSCSSCISFLFFVSPHCLLVTVHGCRTLSFFHTAPHTHTLTCTQAQYWLLCESWCLQPQSAAEWRATGWRTTLAFTMTDALSVFPHMCTCVPSVSAVTDSKLSSQRKPNKLISEPCSLAGVYSHLRQECKRHLLAVEQVAVFC